MEGLTDTSWMMAAQDPMHRKLAMRPAAPLTEHVVSCIAFLTRVGKIEVSGSSKKEFQITVHLNSSADDPESSSSSFTITRTAKEFETIQKAIHDHSRLHRNLAAYDIPSCVLCDQFKEMDPLMFGIFQSLEKAQASVVERLTFLVKGALVPPSSPELHCEGIICIPSGLTKFLLRGVDQTKL